MKTKIAFTLASIFFSASLFAAYQCVNYSNHGSCQGWIVDGKYTSVNPSLNNKVAPLPPKPKFTVYSKFEVPVVMIVTTASNGKGNEKWRDLKYVNAVLAKASSTVGNVTFKLHSLSTHSKNGYYNNASQLPSLQLATARSSGGKIVVVITGENTTSSSGLAWVGYRSKPVFAMRSRFNGSDAYSANAIANTSGIFVHEFGHNFGLGHGGAINTDNYTKSEAGLKKVAEYFRKLTGKSCNQGYSGIGLCMNK